VVDDEDANLLLVRRVLERAGYTSVETLRDPRGIEARFAEARPHLLLLDLHMPGMDGFEVMNALEDLTSGGDDVAFLVLTADVTEEAKRRALEMGARDFLTKPIDQTELLLRVRNMLHVQDLREKLLDHNQSLEATVTSRTRELDDTRIEVLDRLALAGEFRDDDTQEHAQRIGRTAGQLAVELGLAAGVADLLSQAAPLHDIGKIGIPDAILLKPGRLTDAEFEAIKQHTVIGARILSGGRTPLIRLAEDVALTHHERWDGNGYPEGRTGAATPLHARIVSVADVFDALTHERPYKEAWPVDRALEEIESQRGRQFDPDVVSAFGGLDHQSLLERVDGGRMA
jgi:putative two-component system response regulator